MSHYYAMFKENPCVGTDASTPLTVDSYSFAFYVIFYFPNHKVCSVCLQEYRH